MAPAVSVILTAHNYGRFLDQCIRSVLGQTFQDFEVVIVNDGSTDNTAAILERYASDSRIATFSLQGVGLAATANHGIRRSHRRYVMRLDADDFLDPHALMVMVGALDSRPEIGLVYPDYYRVDEQGRFLGYVRVPRVQEGDRLLDNPPLAAGCVYRRSCFDAIGGYDESLRYQEDYDFWLRFTERFGAFGVGLPLLNYRQHGGSMSRNRAPRVAARRHVKREFATRYRHSGGETAVCVIPGTWPGAPARDPALLCRELGGQTAIALAVEQAKACKAIGRVLVATDDPGIGRIARAAGAEIMASPIVGPEPAESVMLTWLRGLARAWAEAGMGVPDYMLLASPYCPLRHPDRLREALDTVLIHGCDLVVSLDGEPAQTWGTGANGLDPVSARGCLLREAGELLAMRTSWLAKELSLDEAVIGYVELLHPEGWCVKDEASWWTCESLLAEASALRVPPSAYLRIEE